MPGGCLGTDTTFFPTFFMNEKSACVAYTFFVQTKKNRPHKRELQMRTLFKVVLVFLFTACGTASHTTEHLEPPPTNATHGDATFDTLLVSPSPDTEDSGTSSKTTRATDRDEETVSQTDTGVVVEPPMDFDCIHMNPSKTLPLKLTKKVFYKRAKRAERMVNKIIERCATDALPADFFDDTGDELYARRSAGYVDWWVNWRGNGIDGLGSLTMTRLFVDSCRWYRVSENYFHGGTYGEVAFESSHEGGIPQKLKEQLATTLHAYTGFAWYPYRQCDPRFGAHLIKASDLRCDTMRSIKSVDGRFKLYLDHPMLGHRIAYSDKPKGGPGVYLSSDDLASIPGIVGSKNKAENPQDGYLVGHTGNPTRVYERGHYQVFHLGVRTRQGGTLVAVYDKNSNKHVWVGRVQGYLSWRVHHGDLLMGETTGHHPAFAEAMGFFILDLIKKTMIQLHIEPKQYAVLEEEEGYKPREWSIVDGVLHIDEIKIDLHELFGN